MDRVPRQCAKTLIAELNGTKPDVPIIENQINHAKTLLPTGSASASTRASANARTVSAGTQVREPIDLLAP